MNIINELSPLSLILLALLLLLSAVFFLTSVTQVKKTLKSNEEKAVVFSENTGLKEALMQEQQRLHQTENELNDLRDQHLKVRERLAASEGDHDRLTNENLSLDHDNNTLREQLSQSREDLARMERELQNVKDLREHDNNNAKKREQELREGFEGKIAALKESFSIQQKELESRLTSLGEKMIKERAEDLRKTSGLQLANTVTPLKEELQHFRELMDRARRDSFEQSGKLTAELKHMQEAQQTLSKQALDLTEALKSGGKSQGMWGELQLERVLDSSGLSKGIEYEREVAGDRALGENGRPDAVIRLPENHCIIIDAKCSLTAFSEYCSADTESEKNRALTAHLSSVKGHIDGLSKRAYQNYRSFNSPSFVFMFVPLDGALQAAFKADHGIYSYAEEKNIYLVSPSTLIPSLRVVSGLWVLARQNDHIRDLAAEAQKIADKFQLVRDAFSDVIKKKESFESSLEVFGNRLTNGRGNLGAMLSRFSARAPAVLKELDGRTLEAETSPDNALPLNTQQED
ncbi:MAG: DNA recombination protein RmuC [Succinatimonas sp.]|nr:DNA recombination protein RmuC [Succinatimonas sp.]